MPSYMMINSGTPILNGVVVNQPLSFPGVSGANYILNDGYAQSFPTNLNSNNVYKTLANRYINGGSSAWEKTLG